jgi:co-chaperonin GroES (HSP10)
MKNFTPINSNLLIRLDSRKAVSDGGIHLPQVSQRAEQWGEVVAVPAKRIAGKGEDKELVPFRFTSPIKKGDRVLVLPTQGTHYILNGEDMIILNEERVLAMESRQETVQPERGFEDLPDDTTGAAAAQI